MPQSRSHCHQFTCNCQVLPSPPSSPCSTPSSRAEWWPSSPSLPSTGSKVTVARPKLLHINYYLVRTEPQEPPRGRHDRLQLYLPLHPVHDVHQTKHPEGARIRPEPRRQCAGREFVAPGPQQVQVVSNQASVCSVCSVLCVLLLK